MEETEFVTVHTADVASATLAEIRALMDLVFPGDFDEHDWEHALGGMHVIGRAGGALVAHASVVQRRLLHGGTALRCGYVEAVGVHPDHRRRGHAHALMREATRIVRSAYEIGALGATDEARHLYESHGWKPWRGESWALTPTGTVRTKDSDGSIMVLEVEGHPLDFTAALTCNWRDGDVW
jgi:aminoglycoside 2'-N-acetyltransferase I